MKYEEGRFLANLPLPLEAKPLSEQLVDAVETRSMKDLVLLLFYSRKEQRTFPLTFETGCTEPLECLLKWVRKEMDRPRMTSSKYRKEVLV